MGIKTIDGSEVIKLKGFKIGNEILLSDCDTMGDYEKVDVLLPKDYLKFLVTDEEILKNINVEYVSLD